MYRRPKVKHMQNDFLTLSPCTIKEQQPLAGTAWILEAAHFSLEYVPLSQIPSDLESYEF